MSNKISFFSIVLTLLCLLGLVLLSPPIWADNPVGADIVLQNAGLMDPAPAEVAAAGPECPFNAGTPPDVGRRSSGRLHQWSNLPPQAVTTTDRARVIVRLKIADYSRLVDQSAASAPPAARRPLSAERRAAASRADAILADAISREATDMLNRLPSDAYRLQRRYQTLPMLALEVTPEAFRRLQSDRQVEAIYANVPTPLPHIYQDTRKPLQYDTSLSGPVRPAMLDTVDQIGARQAWARGYTGQGWYVAILDTGILKTHEFFQGKNILEACFSKDGHCPNNQTSMIGPGAAAHYPDNYDAYDHGTHVAGIAAGRRPDGSMFGVARDADIIAINVFSKFPPEDCWGRDGPPCVMSWTSDQLAALEYVYSLRNTRSIGAVNLSLGEGEYFAACDDDPVKPAIDNLRGVNIAAAISAGNEFYCGWLNAPACISTAVAVMASTKNDQEAYFNNWHSELGRIFAPGENILSAVGGLNNRYAVWSGTSMATPHVTGGLTLMRQADPGASVDSQLARIIERGPRIVTDCFDKGSRERIYVDNFQTKAATSLPGVMMLLLEE